MNSSGSLVTSVVLSLGLILGGGLIGLGLSKVRRGDQYVTVKGLSERNVKANQGTWNIQFSSNGVSLPAAIATHERDQASVLAFLKDLGFTEGEIRKGTPRVSEIGSERSQGYSVGDSVLIVSSDVEKIQKAAEQASDLLKKGVALSGWDQKPQYYFSNLGSIKPAMIEEATKDARLAATQFAQDSESRVGSIRRASQGYFSFQGETDGISESEQINKIARVVITVDYIIED